MTNYLAPVSQEIEIQLSKRNLVLNENMTKEVSMQGQMAFGVQRVVTSDAIGRPAISLYNTDIINEQDRFNAADIN